MGERLCERPSRLLFGVLGVLCGVLLALAVQSSQAFAASWAPAVEAALPANAASNPHVELGSVSCASAGNCTAVGIYYDKSVHQQVLLLSEIAGTWVRGVEAALPADATSNPGICPSGQGGCNYLASVSCSSPGNCSAVGTYYDSSGQQHGLLLSETAGRWAPGVEATLPADAGPAPQPKYVGPLPDVVLGSVTCASAGNCSAVGTYWDRSGHQQGLLLTETNGRWGPGVEATPPAGAGSNAGFVVLGLASVSCGSPGNCSAVGTYNDSSNQQQGLLLTETNGTWAPGVEATPPANANAAPLAGVRLNSVSCVSARDCTAVGSYSATSGGQGLLLSGTNGTWAPAVEATRPANAGSALSLQGVSCPSAGKCSAVGGYNDSSNNQHGLLLTEIAGTWEPGVEATLPANAGPFGASGSPVVALGSVSCASAGNCTALGLYTDTSQNYQPLLVSETAGTWATGVEATPPANAGPLPVRGLPGGVPVGVSSLSCAPPGGCSAVGSYGDKSGHQQGLLLGTLTVLSPLRVSPKTFQLAGRRVNGRCVKQTAKNRTQPSCIRPVKLNVSYQLNIPARVTITIKRAAPGRLSNRRCVAPTRHNRTHRSCIRLLALRGTLTISGRQSSNRFVFNGRIGGRALGPGTYQLTATPSFGSAQTVTFRIAG